MKESNHQVKRMFHSIDNEVLELKRLKISNLTLDENLKSGVSFTNFRRIKTFIVIKREKG